LPYVAAQALVAVLEADGVADLQIVGFVAHAELVFADEPMINGEGPKLKAWRIEDAERVTLELRPDSDQILSEDRSVTRLTLQPPRLQSTIS
jgi:hypothetical protein